MKVRVWRDSISFRKKEVEFVFLQPDHNTRDFPALKLVATRLENKSWKEERLKWIRDWESKVVRTKKKKKTEGVESRTRENNTTEDAPRLELSSYSLPLHEPICSRNRSEQISALQPAASFRDSTRSTTTTISKSTFDIS
jgi:hypothetical protein